jgi:protocatechuate 3,4-dioxygenase beta subunit
MVVMGRVVAVLGLVLASGAAVVATPGGWVAEPLAPPSAAAQPAVSCAPTRPDTLGPFYLPNAPMRTSVGSGYVLTGAVRAADTCQPISDALVEFWLANPQGRYDDDHRASMLASAEGEYRFESNAPPPYTGRPPHIHVRVSAPGFRTPVTQHYPQPGQTEAIFDLVLLPA